MNNVLKRNSKSFIFTALLDIGGGLFGEEPPIKAGDVVRIKKTDQGYIGGTGDKVFRWFPSHLRNGDLLRLDMQWEYYSW